MSFRRIDTEYRILAAAFASSMIADGRMIGLGQLNARITCQHEVGRIRVRPAQPEGHHS